MFHLDQPVTDAQLTTPAVPNYQATLKETDIDVGSSSDTEACHITGSAVLPNNRLVLADANNYKVKLVDIHDNKLKGELKLHSRPWDVTTVSQNKIAVTLPDSGKILFLNVKDMIENESEILVGYGCRGVAYSQDSLVVSYANVGNQCLKIFDLHGNIVRAIENCCNGINLFTRPWYVCVSNDGETIYVSDYSRQAVTSFTLQGTVKSVYEDDELRCPRKMSTDQHGNVYVCGYGNVHMIPADCNMVKTTITQADGLDSDVWSASLCQKTNRLFIGLYGSKYIKVFNIS